MESRPTLLRREGGSPTEVGLLIVLLVLLIVSVLSVGALWFLRRKHKARAALLLPTHVDSEKLSAPIKKGHRRISSVTISPSISLTAERQSYPRFVDEEKRELIATTTPSPSAGPLPQIRITFPEETDDSGKWQSGRVVLLHVDDKGGIGMEPVREDENLPPYETERFVSLDLDRIGGLKEKQNMEATSKIQ